MTSRAQFQIKVVFLIGKTENNETQEKIISESQTHDDLIQESFIDSYNNLTLKSVMMLKWVVNNCDGKGIDCNKILLCSIYSIYLFFLTFTVRFVMKCDDDTFVVLFNLIHYLLGGTIPVYAATLHHYNQRTVRTHSSINRLKYHKDILVGSLFCHVKPISNYRSKW